MTAPAQTAPSTQGNRVPTKAAIALAAWYTAQHSQDQQRLAASTVAALAPLWTILDFQHLDTTQIAWIQAVAPVLEKAYQESQRISADYVQSVRWAQIPAAPPLPQILQIPVSVSGIVPMELPPVKATPSEITVSAAKHFTPEQFPVDAAQVSLLVTGPSEVKRQMPAPETVALDNGFIASSGAAVRIVGAGGRGVVQQLVHLDHQAKGYARVLDKKPCYFCAMLAGRGAVFKERSFVKSNAKFIGDGIQKVHDHCMCSLRPVYSYNDSHDPTALELSGKWDTFTKGYSGKNAVNAFRRGYDAQSGTEIASAAPVQSAADVAKRHLPTLNNTLESLLAQGFSEDSPQVQWNREQIARFTAALN